MPDYKDVLALNVAFHAEAGRVLSLALAGNIADAEKESAVNSRLGKLSAAIMVKLNLWTTLFDTTPKEAHPAHSGGYHARVNHS